VRQLFKITITAILIAVTASCLAAIAYGHTNGASSQLDAYTGQGIEVENASAETLPKATFYGNAIGSIITGDLFIINTANITQDISVNLYLTNIDQLTHSLKYLNLIVVIYYETVAENWERALLADGTPLPLLLLTMNNGAVSFNLPGIARYKISIKSGCFKSHPFTIDQENAIPHFYLETEFI